MSRLYGRWRGQTKLKLLYVRIDPLPCPAVLGTSRGQVWWTVSAGDPVARGRLEWILSRTIKGDIEGFLHRRLHSSWTERSCGMTSILFKRDIYTFFIMKTGQSSWQFIPWVTAKASVIHLDTTVCAYTSMLTSPSKTQHDAILVCTAVIHPSVPRSFLVQVQNDKKLLVRGSSNLSFTRNCHGVLPFFTTRGSAGITERQMTVSLRNDCRHQIGRVRRKEEASPRDTCYRYLGMYQTQEVTLYRSIKADGLIGWWDHGLSHMVIPKSSGYEHVQRQAYCQSITF